MADLNNLKLPKRESAQRLRELQIARLHAKRKTQRRIRDYLENLEMKKEEAQLLATENAAAVTTSSNTNPNPGPNVPLDDDLDDDLDD